MHSQKKQPLTEVIYLSYDGLTDPLGQSQVIPYLIGLSAKGFHFHLISFEKPEPYRKEHLHIQELLKPHHIEWHPLTYTKKPPIISTMRDLSRMKKRATEIAIKHNVKIIHCRSYVSGLAGMALQKDLGLKFIFDMRGFWADERVEGDLWNLSNPLFKAVYKYFKEKEKEMLSAANFVISLTENAKKEIDSRQLRTKKQHPIQVIPCCADLNLFNPEAVTNEAKTKMRHKINLPEKVPVICYLGAIGTWYMLDEMLDFFKVFLIRYPDAVFLFISHEPFKNITSRASLRKIPEKNMMHIAARRNEVPAILSLCDLSIFFIKPTFSKKASSPTKQGEIMGMGKPLICNRGIGDTDYVVDKYGAGISIDLNDPKSMEQAVEKFEELKNIPQTKIIQGAVDFYSLESGVDKYFSVYQKLLE